MGQFSWLDCIDGSQILDNIHSDVYCLVPKEFGMNLHETYYDGYGRFAGQDIYDLVADWNRVYLSNHPEYIIPQEKVRVDHHTWYKYYADLSLSREEVSEYGECEYRWIGIVLACYDKDNAALPYPIKISHRNAVYEECEPSLSDPNQGWL